MFNAICMSWRVDISDCAPDDGFYVSDTDIYDGYVQRMESPRRHAH